MAVTIGGKIKTWTSIVIYIFYRLCHDFLRKIYSQLARPLKSEECEISQILVRLKYADGDLAAPYDFLCYARRIAAIDEILDNPKRWSLYTISHTDAYFVKLPKDFQQYDCAKCPFLYISQFYDATEVARIPLHLFTAAFSPKNNKLENQLIVITMSPRSGSTLLAQILDIEGVTVAYNEPEAFSAIAMEMEEKKWNRATVDSVTIACLSSFCRSIGDPEKKVVLKMHSVATRVAPRIKELFPETNLLHTNRELLSIIRSNDRFLRHTNSVGEMLSLWRLFGRRFATWLSPAARAHASRVENFNAFSCWEFAFIYVTTPYSIFLENESAYSLPLVRFENLISKDNGKLIRDIFEACQIPLEHAKSSASRRLAVDSQADSPYGQKAQKLFPYSTMGDKDAQKLLELAKKMNLNSAVEICSKIA